MSQTDDLDDAAKTIFQLPPDWWQSMHSASVLLQWFRSHVIPLLVAGEVNGTTQYNVYTGLLLEYKQTTVWLTAGHVIDELRQLLSSSAFKLSAMAWLDEFERENAESVRLHRTDIPMNSWQAAGLDLEQLFSAFLTLAILRRTKRYSPSIREYG